MNCRSATMELVATADAANVVATHVCVRKGEAASTREIVPGVVFADYDADGCLLGVEVLATIPLAIREANSA